MMGDFSGRGERGAVDTGADLARRRPLPVDRDSVEDAMLALGVELAGIRFRELDDFHPDRLYETVPLFQAVRALRRKLEDPAYVAQLAGRTPSPPRSEPAPAPPLPSGDLLGQILDASEPGAADAGRPRGRPDEFQRFLTSIVEPHLAPGTGKADRERQQEMLAATDAGIASLMREVLRHPDIQAVEGAWRAVDLVVRRLETGTHLKVYLLDLSRAELTADLADGDIARTGLYKLLVEQTRGTAGAEGWSVIAGAYGFGPSDEDLAALEALSRIAQASGAPFLAGADSRLAGCPDFSAAPDPDDWSLPVPDAWLALRRSPAARSVGLFAPRFLARLPYGRESSPCERFAFEELTRFDDHQGYLWANSAFLGALVLGELFAADGWSLTPGVNHRISGLPLHSGVVDGGPEMKPCAEMWMSERAAGRLAASGIVPVASLKNTDAAQIVRFQSIADPVRSLAGPWEG